MTCEVVRLVKAAYTLWSHAPEHTRSQLTPARVETASEQQRRVA